MKKITSIFVAVLFVFAVAIQISAQAQRDIAVVGHNRNFSTGLGFAAPNSTFGGWAGGAATFQVFTAVNPGSYLKNKLTGGHDPNCTATLDILNVPAAANFYNTFGPVGANLLFAGTGTFVVNCAGGNILRGSFSRAILNVVNGSNSASIILLGNTVTYVAPTNVINNAVGNFAFTSGSLSIGIITDQPVGVTMTSSTTGTITNFRAYSNITFGARKI